MYSTNWKYETIIAQEYEISEPEQISKTNGRQLDLALNNSYINSKYCKKYIIIDNDNLKKVLLKVRKPKYKDDIYYFQIKYEIEKYQNQIQITKDEADKKEKDKTEYINPYISYDINNENKTEYSFIVGVIFIFLIAIGLSLPNFVSACLMPEVEKNKRDTIIYGLFFEYNNSYKFWRNNNRFFY